ncbi:MAG: penicillin-binding protein [Saprospirales bacterium]|nr:penicillin-binding protein [Saprospirales bacterium]
MTDQNPVPQHSNSGDSGGFLHSLKRRWARFSKERPRTAKWLKRLGMAAGSLFLLMLLFVILVYAGAFGKLPSYAELRDINQNVASEVYSEDGELLGKFFIENRLPADLDDLPEYVINALVATEDARFFQHSGIDLRAWVRVFLRTVLLMDRTGGGGSTLSQQLAKNLYPRKDHGIFSIPVAKVKEIFIAHRLEQIYDKDQLLALYLNTVSFGENIYGIKVASQRFFGEDPKDLTVEQAAMLVGMLKGPNLYNPVRHPERAQTRRNVVLQQMSKYGYLEPADCDSLQAIPLEVNYSHESHYEGMATYFRSHLRQQLDDELSKLTKPDGRPYNLYTDGLKIYTTINSRMQRYAEEAVNRQMAEVQRQYYRHLKGRRNALPWGSNQLLRSEMKKTKRYQVWKEQGHSDEEIDSLFKLPVNMTIFDWRAADHNRDTLLAPMDSLKYYLSLFHAGFLALEPATGKVRAWVGGIDFKYFQYDHVKSKRQVGSTFKPILYSAALMKGVDPCQRFPNELITYEEYQDWTPRNAEGEYGGSYSMKGALKKSVNTVAAQLIMQTGIEPVRELARSMGISSDIPKEPGIALGAVDASLYEMVQVYATLANQGRKPEPWYLVRVETAEGDTLIDFDRPHARNFEQVLSDSIARVMTTMLQAVVNEGTGARLRSQFGFQYAVAGKTGTTNNNADGWFLGYTPDLAFGAWVGASQPVVRFHSTSLGQGSATALPICGYFLNRVYRNPRFKKFKESKFEQPDSSALANLDCYDYIPADSVLIDSFLRLMMLPEDSIVRARKLELADMIITSMGEEVLQYTPRFFDQQNEDGNGYLPENIRREILRLRNDEQKEIRREKRRRRQEKRKRNLWERLFGKKQRN